MRRLHLKLLVIVGNRLDNHIYNKPELGVGSIDQCHCSYISVFSLSAIGFSTYSTSKTHYQVYFRLSPFHSNEYQIDYFASGEGAIRIDRRWIKCGPGSFSFIPPLVPHEILYEQSQDMDNYGVKFQFSADPRIKSPPASPFVIDVAEEKQGEALGLFKKIVGEYTMDLPISPENLNQLITLVYDLQEREGAGGKKNSLASRVKRIVRAGYAGPLRVSAIAAQVGGSPEHLSRNFRKTTGKTLAEYITVCRLRSALVMLQNTALPIKQIASECGFSSVNYFSNRFKKYYARTPGEMRRREPAAATAAP